MNIGKDINWPYIGFHQNAYVWNFVEFKGGFF